MYPAYAAPSEKVLAMHADLVAFMRDEIFPREPSYEAFPARGATATDHDVPPQVEELKVLAKERGLWNLFLRTESGLTQLEYAPLAELTGWSLDLAPKALNCQAPDTGNMELLHLRGTPEQQDRWLRPLLDGTIRSAAAPVAALRAGEAAAEEVVVVALDPGWPGLPRP